MKGIELVVIRANVEQPTGYRWRGADVAPGGKAPQRGELGDVPWTDRVLEGIVVGVSCIEAEHYPLSGRGSGICLCRDRCHDSCGCSLSGSKRWGSLPEVDQATAAERDQEQQAEGEKHTSTHSLPSLSKRGSTDSDLSIPRLGRS